LRIFVSKIQIIKISIVQKQRNQTIALHEEPPFAFVIIGSPFQNNITKAFMKFVKHLLFSAVLFISTQAQAQHEYIFTNYYMSPMTLNPAMVGAYEGTYRVGALQRRQWNIGTSTYQTLSAFADMPVLMIKKRHWIGAGLSYYNDGAGSGDNSKIGQNYFSLSAAFHYAIDKKYKNVLTLGISAGGGTDGFTPGSGPLTGKDYKDGSTTSSLALSKDNKVSSADISAGIMLKSKIDKKSDLSLGIAVRHINTANISLGKVYGSTTKAKLPAAFTFHTEYNRILSKKLSIAPNFLYRKIAGSQDISLQAVLGYQISPKRKDLILKGGLGMRGFGNHAVNVLLGADYQNFKLMLGYDIPTGEVSRGVNNTLELALHYTGKVYKNPVVKGIHFCPKY
jgi:type IX secretion system PorP/SprF family membrane protein